MRQTSSLLYTSGVKCRPAVGAATIGIVSKTVINGYSGIATNSYAGDMCKLGRRVSDDRTALPDPSSTAYTV